MGYALKKLHSEALLSIEQQYKSQKMYGVFLLPFFHKSKAQATDITDVYIILFATIDLSELQTERNCFKSTNKLSLNFL